MATIRPDRSPEALRRHYELEKELAQRILQSAPEDRSRVTKACYDEMYRSITDHPYFTVTPEEQWFRDQVAALFVHLIGSGHDVLEAGCGTGDRAVAVARAGNRVTGLEIASEVVGQQVRDEPGVELVIDDAIHLGKVADQSFDVVFSNQLVEHFHPEDTALHFASVARVLRPGGRYIFDTPNRLLGPADISRYFGDELAKGFHLKEWTYREIRSLMRSCGFRSFRSPWGRMRGYLEEPRRIDRAMLPVEAKLPFEWLVEVTGSRGLARWVNRPMILPIMLEGRVGN